MSTVTTNLNLNKFVGNLQKFSDQARHVSEDSNLDAVDAAIGTLQAASSGFEVKSGDGAIVIKEGTAFITKSSAAALTLPTPVSGSRASGGDDGKKLRIIATTAHAHTVTTPADVINGADDTVTFAAVADFVDLTAYGGVWYAAPGGPTPASLSEA